MLAIDSFRRYLDVLRALDDVMDAALKAVHGYPDFAFLHARQRLASALAAVPAADVRHSGLLTAELLGSILSGEAR
jgi:hypothetical protein